MLRNSKKVKSSKTVDWIFQSIVSVSSSLMAYPGYGAPQCPPGPEDIPGAHMDPFYSYFSQVAGADSQISVRELQECLDSTGWCKFSVETCQMMISMLDRDYSGKMGYNEFKELWPVLQKWRETFVRQDGNKTGRIETSELHNTFKEWGYNVSPQFVQLVIYKFDYEYHRGLNLDQFICACIILRGLTTHFQQRDTSRDGHAKFMYDDFMQVSFSYSPV